MNEHIRNMIWNQFGAAIDTLENAINACPDQLYSDTSRYHQFWYWAYHTLFWLDFYLSDRDQEYSPPPPFTLSELDPSGKLPDRVYTREELLAFLEHGRRKCRERLRSLTDEDAQRSFKFGSTEMTFAELLLYNMRHVQHHAAQLNLILRQEIDSAPRWVGKTRVRLED